MSPLVRCGAALLLAATLAAPVAHAGDRPFAATSSAVGEEDDDQVWSLETGLQRLGRQRGLALAPEYAFDPQRSLQVELLLQRERGGEHRRAVEAEYKHLFNSFARDGWGVGVVLALELAKSGEQRWRREGVALRLPISLQLGAASDAGSMLLHLNVGVEKEREERRAFAASVATEVPLHRRFTAYAELARDGETKLAHVGVRHWVKRERFAVDIGLLHSRADGERRSGWVLGLSWFDL